MAYRIAINGYGRIGRCVLRAFYESTDYADMQLVAINDLADIANLSHLTRYDSTHGRFQGTVETSNATLQAIYRAMMLAGLAPDARQLECAVVDALDLKIVQLLNQRVQHAGEIGKIKHANGADYYDPTREAQVMAKVARLNPGPINPVLKAINETFKIESGAITTIHSAMNDQPVIDSYHDDDLRKTRSAMQSIIPVGTALAKGIERILPELSGLLEAQAIRVPTLNVSLMDLTLSVATTTNVEEVNRAIREASASLPANVLGFTDEPLASCDFNHDPRSAIVDMNHTSVAYAPR